ncbi:hypothetical protein H1R20_g14849, partial [Candolleomyces eurysporus]
MAKTDRQDLRRSKRAKHAQSTAPTGKPSKGPARERKQAQNAEKGAILKYIREMPLDVLLEIFSHLEPADLIHLSRTTKALRSIMMVRSSRSIWTQALASIPDLPPCPDDLIEAQYANLMFTDYCHECLTNADDDPNLLLLMFMEARTQLCHKCAPCKFKTARAFSGSFQEVKSVVPMTKESFETYSYSEWNPKKYHVDVANELMAEYDKLTPVERGGWLLEQTAKQKAISKHAEACEIFFQARLEQDEQMIASIRLKRQDQVIERLKELGKLSLASPIVVVIKLFLRIQRRSSLSRKWEEVEPEMLEWVEQQKAKHHFKQRVACVESRIREWLIPIYAEFMASRPHQGQAVHPTLLEISFLEEFRAALEDTPLGQSPSAEVTEAAIAKLPELVDRWQQTHDDALLELVKQSHSSKNSEISRETLFHATTSFECESCHEKGLLYPNVLAHRCNFLLLSKSGTAGFVAAPTKYKQKKRKRDEESENKEEVPGAYIKQVFSKVNPLSTDHLRFSEAGYLHTIQVLDLLGLAHDTSSKDLRSKAPPLECHCFCYDVINSSSKAPVRVIHWPKLVSFRPLSLSRCCPQAGDANFRTVVAGGKKNILPGKVTPTFICPACTKTEWNRYSLRHFRNQ